TRGTIRDVGEIDSAQGILPGSDQSVGESLNGWYLEAGADLLAIRNRSRQSLVPFVRYERFDTQASVPDGFLRDPSLDQSIGTVGISWKPIPQVVLKADYQDRDRRSGDGVDEFHVGLGWIF